MKEWVTLFPFNMDPATHTNKKFKKQLKVVTNFGHPSKGTLTTILKIMIDKNKLMYF